MQRRDEVLVRKILGEIDFAVRRIDTINMEDLYQTIKEDFPQLKIQITNIYDDKFALE